jgi:hypothetical protein
VKTLAADEDKSLENSVVNTADSGLVLTDGDAVVPIQEAGEVVGGVEPNPAAKGSTKGVGVGGGHPGDDGSSKAKLQPPSNTQASSLVQGDNPDDRRVDLNGELIIARPRTRFQHLPQVLRRTILLVILPV